MAKGLYQKWQEPEQLALLKGWRRDGLKMQQIADNIGIKRQTLYDWCTKYKDISDALKKGTEVSNYEVENSMYKSAIGFFVTEQDQTEVKSVGADGIERTTTTKHQRRRYVPPNLGAMIFILKNRLPEKWRDHPVVEDNRALETLANILEETKKAIEREDADIQQEAEGLHTECEPEV